MVCGLTVVQKRLPPGVLSNFNSQLSQTYLHCLSRINLEDTITAHHLKHKTLAIPNLFLSFGFRLPGNKEQEMKKVEEMQNRAVDLLGKLYFAEEDSLGVDHLCFVLDSLTRLKGQKPTWKKSLL